MNFSLANKFYDIFCHKVMYSTLSDILMNTNLLCNTLNGLENYNRNANRYNDNC